MTYYTRALQARCAALGFWPGPIDGEHGKRTQAAYEDALGAQRGRGRPFQHPSGLTRVHLHWTGGAHKATAFDASHYHVLVEGDGTVLRPHPPTERLAHTLNANGGAIGVSLCAMDGAVERPFSAGKSPVTARQVAAGVRVVRELCEEFDIPNTRWSVLTHAEVQITLGIRQRGKWDVCWLPGMAGSGDPIAVGDKLRAMISHVVL